MTETQTNNGIMALTSNWLHAEDTFAANASGSGGASVTTNGLYQTLAGVQWYGYPNYTYPYVQTVTEPAKPIKLTFSEVERLRKAARSDKALRDVLQKFTPQIEVVVEL